MAAITPHLEEQADPSERPVEKELAKIRVRRMRLPVLQGVGQGHDATTDLAIENHGVQVAHSNLTATVWTRRALEEELQDRKLTVGTQGRDLILILDKPLIGPQWNPVPGGAIKNISVLAWTKKMGCPSFSLPAGPVMFGGSCLGAVGGQSIVPLQALRDGAQRVAAIVGQPVNLADAICEWCYAIGGNYRYANKQMAQVALYMWARKAVADGTFAPAMDWAIKNADFKLAAFTRDGTKYPAEKRGKFFRLHDSGDFFSAEYLRAWKAIADKNPDVMFWAPSRLWAVGRAGIDLVNQINYEPRNLIIRASAFSIDQAAPANLGPGWAGGSTVFDLATKPPGGPFHEHGVYNWDCQAYAVEKEAHTCRHALAPDGKQGCRACWLQDDYVVNYTKH